MLALATAATCPGRGRTTGTALALTTKLQVGRQAALGKDLPLQLAAGGRQQAPGGRWQVAAADG